MSSKEKLLEECLSQQVDEIEALTSIYPDKVVVLESNSLDINIEDENHGDLSVKLHVAFPEEYPISSPPTYELSAPFLRGTHKSELCGLLEEVYMENMGEPLVFLWIEKIREFIETKSQELTTSENEIAKDLESNLRISEQSRIADLVECPEILTGDCIEDRKSVFQGHYAKVSNASEVKAVISKLYENRKIANATHNMYAYRIRTQDNHLLQDCDDDGESQAGGRMLHLLEILGVENVLVVVTRWYGGTHLGPDRFKHINNAARAILELAGVIESKNKAVTSKNKK